MLAPWRSATDCRPHRGSFFKTESEWGWVWVKKLWVCLVEFAFRVGKKTGNDPLNPGVGEEKTLSYKILLGIWSPSGKIRCIFITELNINVKSCPILPVWRKLLQYLKRYKGKANITKTQNSDFLPVFWGWVELGTKTSWVFWVPTPRWGLAGTNKGGHYFQLDCSPSLQSRPILSSSTWGCYVYSSDLP